MDIHTHSLQAMAEFPGASFGQPDPPETKVRSAFIKMIPLCSLVEPDYESLASRD